jgi:preprotein translocase subunit SecY
MTAIFKICRDILQIPELRRRIWWTFVLLFVFRIGFHIYLPGIHAENFKKTIESSKGTPDLLEFLIIASNLTGGRFDAPVAFSLGIMPYITASIIFSLLVKVFPRLDALSKEGEQGRKIINRYTRYATVLICIVQALLLVRQWGGVQVEGRYIVTDPNSSFVIPFLQILCLTTGSLFLMWLGEKITEVGIGNGTSLLIMVGIIASLPAAFATQVKDIINAEADLQPFLVVKALVLMALYFLVVAGVVFITKGQRRIPVQQQRSVRGRRVYGGQRSYMPFRVNPAGVLPIIFAQSLILLPVGFLSFIGNSSGIDWLASFFNNLSASFQPNSFIYVLTYIGLIVFFTYFWTSLMFNPVEIAHQMKEYGSFIPGIRPGKRTAEYLDSVMKRITLAGSAFLCLIALVPQFISESLDVQYIISSFLGGTGILIIVGVALDLVDKIEAQLLVRQYEGFMRGGEGPGRGPGPMKKPAPTV